MKYVPIWYDQDSVVKEDPPITANTEMEARNLAYRKYNGTPPAPLLYLKPME